METVMAAEVYHTFGDRLVELPISDEAIEEAVGDPWLFLPQYVSGAFELGGKCNIAGASLRIWYAPTGLGRITIQPSGFVNAIPYSACGEHAQKVIRQIIKYYINAFHRN